MTSQHSSKLENAQLNCRCVILTCTVTAIGLVWILFELVTNNKKLYKILNNFDFIDHHQVDETHEITSAHHTHAVVTHQINSILAAETSIVHVNSNTTNHNHKPKKAEKQQANDYHSGIVIPTNFSPNAIFSKITQIDTNIALFSSNMSYMNENYPYLGPPVNETIVNYTDWIDKFPFNFKTPIDYSIKIDFDWIQASININSTNNTYTRNMTSNLTLNNNIIPWQNNIVDTKLKWPFPFFIFEFGDPRTGTTALKHFFDRNGLPVIHNSLSQINKQYGNKNWLTSLRTQSINNLDCKHGKYKRIFDNFEKKFMYFGEFGPWNYLDSKNNRLFRFEMILKQYPNSKYIWNFRSIKDRLRSKFFWTFGEKKNSNITNFEWNTILEIADHISSHFDGSVIEPAESKDEVQKDARNEPDDYILNFWKPKTSLKDGISAIVEYYNEHQT